MALTNWDLFYMVARAACFCLGFVSYFTMGSVPIYDLHWAFLYALYYSPSISLVLTMHNKLFTVYSFNI